MSIGLNCWFSSRDDIEEDKLAWCHLVLEFQIAVTISNYWLTQVKEHRREYHKPRKPLNVDIVVKNIGKKRGWAKVILFLAYRPVKDYYFKSEGL